MNMVEKIGDLLLREMQTKNITEMEMASRLGVSPGTINKYTRRRVQNPDVVTLAKVAAYFAVPYEHFFGGDEAIAGHRDPDLTELVEIYRAIDPEQREKLLDYARDRERLSRHYASSRKKGKEGQR